MGSLNRRLEALEKHTPAPEDDSREVLGRLTDSELERLHAVMEGAPDDGIVARVWQIRRDVHGEPA